MHNGYSGGRSLYRRGRLLWSASLLAWPLPIPTNLQPRQYSGEPFVTFIHPLEGNTTTILGIPKIYVDTGRRLPHYCAVTKQNSSKTSRTPNGITEKQACALWVIRALITSKPYPPTLREIGECLDMSKQAVSRLLVILERKGYVIRPIGFRMIQLTGKELPYATKGRAA